MRAVGARQVAATLLSHHAHVYAVELTADEMAWLVAHEGVVRGASPGERTSVRVVGLPGVRESGCWSKPGLYTMTSGSLGMIG